MKTMETYEEKKSLFKKLIDAFKNTALYTIFFDETSGMAIDADNIDQETKLAYLSQSSGLSTDEVKAINDAFGKANSNMATLISRVTPANKKEKNPFKVEEKDLKHDVSAEISTEKVQEEISRDDR